jgi:hypothetical protein
MRAIHPRHQTDIFLLSTRYATHCIGPTPTQHEENDSVKQNASFGVIVRWYIFTVLDQFKPPIPIAVSATMEALNVFREFNKDAQN